MSESFEYRVIAAVIDTNLTVECVLIALVCGQGQLLLAHTAHKTVGVVVLVVHSNGSREHVLLASIALACIG